MININEIDANIARNILKTSPTCSNNPTIFLSAIGSLMLANSLYDIVSTANFNIGIIHIPITINTPTSPTAFFKTIPQPKTVSTASPNTFPTIGIAELTIAFVVFAVIPIYTTR